MCFCCIFAAAMTLTYIFHSGFMLHADEAVIIFDYWMDPARVVPDALRCGKPVYVLASHFHEDHFNRDIFSWRSTCPDIRYILSKDILRHRRATREEADAWLGKGACWTDSRLSVTATGSNDSGVSWIVEIEGRKIFHAGDLNNWFSRFLSDADPGTTIHSYEMEIDVNPVAEEKRFLGELKDIRKLASHFDLVMFPVDGRIGNGYTLGGRQFLQRFDVGLFVPMHFVASGFESAWRFREYAEERHTAFWAIEREGDEITF